MREILTAALRRRHAFSVLIGSMALAGSLVSAGAQVPGEPAAPASASAAASAVPNAAQAPVRAAKPYFIEFRARNAESYGHTFSVYGRLDARGKPVGMRVAGLHPFSESPIPWMVGHLVVVPSETGPSDGDTEDQYVLARFRVLLSEAEYKKVTTYIKNLQAKSPMWHAVIYNCNAFVGDIASFMGLKTPNSTMLMPKDYIDGIRDLNINRVHEAGIIGTPVKVEDAEALRAAALKAIARNQKTAASRLAAVQHPARPKAQVVGDKTSATVQAARPTTAPAQH